ncbi:uncharacterized protein [Coffea arabica]|uniref:Helitron helicase-like domain-containing protein n=1 Tax=Coffea arabica TaxID=13443 RepID=A0ABM4W375_COFAR
MALSNLSADCRYCAAKKFYSETASFWCSDGDAVLHQNRLPDVLIELYTGHTEEAVYFPTYLYFHDTDLELHNRLAVSEKLTESIVVKIMDMMKANPYACFFRSLRNVPNLDSCQIVLKTFCDTDQRVFNKPTASQVAALWVEGDESNSGYARHIQVYTKDGQQRRVQYYYRCYDALQYHCCLHLEKLDGIQMRADCSPSIVNTGRLFQQLAVDMYIKIESQRLDFYRHKQQLIGREQLQGIMGSIIHGQSSGSKIGQRVALPASFIGGPRSRHEKKR